MIVKRINFVYNVDMGLFASDNTRSVRKLQKIADLVIALEDDYAALDDKALIAKTAEFKQRLADGETLDDILPEAFATVREAAYRVLGQKAYYVQILGGIALHQGRIAEMKTGEGKTLVSTMPAYLNALTGKGVHIVEVNEYLAKRNSEWMGKVHRFLGLTVGLSLSHATPDVKRHAYNQDITYVTSSEVGFDYLRDNVAHHKQDRVLHGMNYAIIDEIDSILIDESRTPLIMSSPTKDNSDLYKITDKFVRGLTKDDFEVDLKERAVRLTESGFTKAERAFNIENISDADNMELNHFINNAMKAHHLFTADVDYIINSKKEIIIIDQNTGRAMVGRRYSDGLHQAIEAKENVPIKNEDKTVATITIQNLFKLYRKLSGMTGTAKTEEDEFKKIYGVDVVAIPTNKPVLREDAPDVIFQNMTNKLAAIYEDVLYRYERKQPVLIGTTTIERSEEISRYLKSKKVPHVVLNAKNHEKEADIVASAGRLGSVTIATNMAGRGTDIHLGGNAEHMAMTQLKKDGLTDQEIYDATAYFETKDEKILAHRKLFKDYLEQYKKETEAERNEVVALGGLHIIGTERHDSRRIDNQLRGRAGRQGDPGSSIFYISCDDEIMKRFGKDVIGGTMRFLNLDDVQSKMITKLFERVQKRVEGYYFDSRRVTFEYDNVLNDQRMVIYRERDKILDGENVHEQIVKCFPDLVYNVVSQAINPMQHYTEWDLDKANQVLSDRLFGTRTEYLDEENTNKANFNDVYEMVLDAVNEQYEAKIAKLKEEGFNFDAFERDVLLSIVDKKWVNHIDAMVNLRNGISLRGYGGKDPLFEYRREAIGMFNDMIEAINNESAIFLFKVRIERQEAPKPKTPVINNVNLKKAGRNDACPCGSGKKYKQCCGKLD